MFELLHRTADTVASWFGGSPADKAPPHAAPHAARAQHDTGEPAEHSAHAQAAASQLFSGFAEDGKHEQPGNGAIEDKFQTVLGGSSPEAMKFRQQVASSSLALSVFDNEERKGSYASIEIDMNAVLGEAARSDLTLFEALKRNIEASSPITAGNWEMAHKLASQVAGSLGAAQARPELLERFQDEQAGGLKVGAPQDSMLADAKGAAPGKERHFEAPTAKDIVATLKAENLTDDGDKSEVAVRGGFMALAKDQAVAGGFSKAVVSGLKDLPPEKRAETLEFLLYRRGREAEGGSRELFDMYDRMAHAMVKDANTPVTGDYSLDFKGKSRFTGTPAAVALENRSHEELQAGKDKVSATAEQKLTTETPNGAEGMHTAVASGPLFDKGVTASDVLQGGLGDCFFMASLAATAHAKPELIQKQIAKAEKFPDGSEAPAGQAIYGVTFYTPGADGISRPVKIYVTNAVMASDDGGFLGTGLFAKDRAAYARASNSPEIDQAEAWPMIYEKAYAKFLGSYEALNAGGQGKNALEAITGMHATDHRTKQMSDEQLFQAVEAGAADNNPMTASSRNKNKAANDDTRRKELALGDGIVSGHQYTVLGAHKNEKGEIRIKVRNPWGKDGLDQGDGVQELSIEQFKTYFPELTTTAGPIAGQSLDLLRQQHDAAG